MTILSKNSIFAIMKKVLTAVLVIASILLCQSPADACTNLIVGKKASADGSVICTYNCDGFGFAASLGFYRPGRHEKGETIAIRQGWGPDAKINYIPQVEYTYGVAGLVNEKQVSIVETTWDGRRWNSRTTLKPTRRKWKKGR